MSASDAAVAIGGAASPVPPRRLRAVLLPTPAWGPERAAYQSGAGPDPLALDRHLAARGIDVVLLDPGRRPLNPLAGRGTLLESFDPIRALRLMLSERRADIVVSIFEGAALPLTLLRGLAAFRAPVVLWDVALTDSWALRERVLDRVLPRVDGIFVLSAMQKDYIATRWGRRHGVEILGHSIDTNFFCPAPKPADGTVLAVGEDYGRDFPALLAAVDGVDARIVIKTASLAADQVVPSNVTVVRQRMSHLDFRALYAASRFAVVPLQQTLNASGVSTILEAGAMGLATVVSDNAAIRDFVVPGETCLMVPCGDRAAMRVAITRLLREPETCARLGANARRFVERTCAMPVFTDKFASLLRRYARRDVPA